jgi:hypothetical protein
MTEIKKITKGDRRVVVAQTRPNTFTVTIDNLVTHEQGTTRWERDESIFFQTSNIKEALNMADTFITPPFIHPPNDHPIKYFHKDVTSISVGMRIIMSSTNEYYYDITNITAGLDGLIKVHYYLRNDSLTDNNTATLPEFRKLIRPDLVLPDLATCSDCYCHEVYEM